MTDFRMIRPSEPKGTKASSSPLRNATKDSVWLLIASAERPQKDRGDIGSLDVMVGSPLRSANVANAMTIRSETGIRDGTMSERNCGSRERNLQKTWFAIDAWPGTMLRVLDPPK